MKYNCFQIEEYEVECVNKFSLANELSQSIVDGILKGYKEYLDVRRRAQKDLKVSGAYAWVKGNHIDSSVDEACSNYNQVQSSIEKAGYTWEYLQFVLKDTQEKYLVIVKIVEGSRRLSMEKWMEAKRIIIYMSMLVSTIPSLIVNLCSR